jgi:type II secretory pathway pseudopilin PulG
MRRRRGWVFMDVVMALILISLIAMMLAIAAGWNRRALDHLSDSRAAARLAESSLISLQSGQAPASGAPITFRKLSASTEIPGHAWVEVDAAVKKHHATLVGLVPQAALHGGGGS